MNLPEVTKVESLEIDESAIALVLSVTGRMSPESRHNAGVALRAAIPNLSIPVLVLDGGTRLEVLKASDVKTLSELLGITAL